MKQIFIFTIFLSLLSCDNSIKNKQTSLDFSCPRVFFSTGDRIYIDNSISLDNILIKAEFNNFTFNKQCLQKKNTAVIPLDILIVAKPMDNLEESLLSLPVFITLLDANDKILETQYFSVSGFMNKNSQTNSFIETEIIDRLTVATKYLDTSQLIIGFMLDDKKKNLLN